MGLQGGGKKTSIGTTLCVQTCSLATTQKREQALNFINAPAGPKARARQRPQEDQQSGDKAKLLGAEVSPRSRAWWAESKRAEVQMKEEHHQGV